ncbi:MAG TPA: hypothetical protein VJN18_32585 [Polyangiaceae bacterium]|nr:hypothetical protein [Polyangiaceae bacterium]
MRFSQPDHVSRCREILDLTERQLEIVIGLLAAEHWGWTPCSLRELEACLKRSAQSEIHRLERGLWVECAGWRPSGTSRQKEKLWRPSVRARVRLSFHQWEPVTDEELAALIQAGALDLSEEMAAS